MALRREGLREDGERFYKLLSIGESIYLIKIYSLSFSKVAFEQTLSIVSFLGSKVLGYLK